MPANLSLYLLNNQTHAQFIDIVLSTESVLINCSSLLMQWHDLIEAQCI
jgi:hypothetical protein